MGIFSFLFKNKANKINDYLSKKAVLLDVRTYDEYNKGHIEGAVHIPIQELKGRIEEVVSLQKPVITYCASGIRSEKARNMLTSKGIDTLNGGGMNTVKHALKQ